MKVKAKIAPHKDSPELFIWQVRNLQLENSKEWEGRKFFYHKYPFYQMRAVANVESKTMHFAFNDSSVPDNLKGGAESFVHLASKEIVEVAGFLNVNYKGKNYLLKFDEVLEEEPINCDKDGIIQPDLMCRLVEGNSFITACGSQYVAIEFRNSNSVSLGKKGVFRRHNITGFEVIIGLSSAWQFEQKFRKNGKCIPIDYLEETYNRHKSFLLKWKHKIGIIHFPTDAERYKEGRHTRKVKSKVKRKS